MTINIWDIGLYIGTVSNVMCVFSEGIAYVYVFKTPDDSGAPCAQLEDGKILLFSAGLSLTAAKKHPAAFPKHFSTFTFSLFLLTAVYPHLLRNSHTGP